LLAISDGGRVDGVGLDRGDRSIPCVRTLVCLLGYVDGLQGATQQVLGWQLPCETSIFAIAGLGGSGVEKQLKTFTELSGHLR